ncbi:MAG: lytic transglycosylase domain-containing protein [Thermoanaerobaculia bacterium]
MRNRIWQKVGLALCALALTGLRPRVPSGSAPASPNRSAAAPATAPDWDVLDFPTADHDRVDRMIDAYCNRVHDRFEEGLENANRYEPLIRTAFQAEGLPGDLVYVAMIESSFRPTARSNARAQGIWQFMKSTGHRFGLKSDKLVDERADPMKATLAAAKFWKTLYGEYGDWNLAMAAYNSGEGRVSSAIRRTGLDDYWGLCRQNALPRETCNYVPGVIAAGMIARDPRQYGFDVKPAEAPEFDTVVVDRPIDLRTLARRSDVDLGQLRELNPELRTTRVPARKTGYPLVVPTEDREAIESTLSNHLADGKGGRAGRPAARARNRRSADSSDA